MPGFIQIKLDHSFVLSRVREASSTLASPVQQQLHARSDAYKLVISLHNTSFEQSNEVILVVYTFNQVHKVYNSEIQMIIYSTEYHKHSVYN